MKTLIFISFFCFSLYGQQEIEVSKGLDEGLTDSSDSFLNPLLGKFIS